MGVGKQIGETQGQADLRSMLAECFIGQSHSSLSLAEEGETGVRLRQQQLPLPQRNDLQPVRSFSALQDGKARASSWTSHCLPSRSLTFRESVTAMLNFDSAFCSSSATDRPSPE